MSIPSDSPHQSFLNSDTSLGISFLQRSFSENNISIRSSSEASLLLQPSYSSSISSPLKTPIAPAKLPTKNVKASGQVLTSTDLMKKMEEAEKLKEDKAKEKKEREIKRLEKAKQKSIKGNEMTIVSVKTYLHLIAVEREKTITRKTLSKKQPSTYVCPFHFLVYMYVCVQITCLITCFKQLIVYNNDF